MAYENLCMYCFQDRNGSDVCPHCGKDSRASVPKIQLLPGTLIYNNRFLIGRALGQDANGIVYNAFDTKRQAPLRIREYLPRNCADRLNDGSVVPLPNMEDTFDRGMQKLRSSVENKGDPKTRHFYFEQNGTAYVAQRPGVPADSASRSRQTIQVSDDDADESDRRRSAAIRTAIIAAAVVLAALVVMIVFDPFNDRKDITVVPTVSPTPTEDNNLLTLLTPEPTEPEAAPTRTASSLLFDPELNWIDSATATPTAAPKATSTPQVTQYRQTAIPTPTSAPQAKTTPTSFRYVGTNSSREDITTLQERLADLGWLEEEDINGVYDSATKSAVTEFQKYVNENCSPSKKLTVDGLAGEKTQQWLYSETVLLNRPAPTPSPVPTRRATATPTAKSTKTPAPTEDPAVDASSPKAKIRSLQRKLITLGLLNGSADGVYGKNTTSAVRSFQKHVNFVLGYKELEESGTADSETMNWIDYYTGEGMDDWMRETATAAPTAKPTSTPTPAPTENNGVDSFSDPEVIKDMQRQLVYVGLLSASEVTGVYDSRTTQAVRAFQQWVNEVRRTNTLTVDGACDRLTSTYLDYCVKNDMTAKASPTPTAIPTRAPSPTPTQEVYEPENDDEEQDADITIYSAKETITYMQEMLNGIGLLPARKVNGVYGPETENAVRALQNYVNTKMGKTVLSVSGTCDAQTLQYLEYCFDKGWDLSNDEASRTPTPAPQSESSEIGPDSSASRIKYLRNMLADVGLMDASSGDGTYDSATENAVRALQRFIRSESDSSIAVSGICDEDTLNWLIYYVNHNWILSDGEEENLAPDVTEAAPTQAPTAVPTQVPTAVPTEVPTQEPTAEPTSAPTAKPEPLDNLTIRVGDQVADGSVIYLEGGSYLVRWRVDGSVSHYHLQLYQDGVLINENPETGSTSFEISTSSLTRGALYELRIGAVSEDGSELWESVTLMRKAETTPEPEVTEEPAGTPEPTGTPAPEPLSNLKVLMDDQVCGEDEILLNNGSYHVRWRVDGDVQYYTLELYEDGNLVKQARTDDSTSFELKAESLTRGVSYELRIGAVGEDGTELWKTVSLMRKAEPTPEPTETPEPEPTPEPTVAIGKPVISIGGSGHQQDGIKVVTSEEIIFSWMAEGDIASYEVTLHRDTEKYSLKSGTTATSCTVNASQLEPGLYSIEVIAVPNGNGTPTQNTLSFIIPSDEPEEPEVTEAPTEKTRKSSDGPSGPLTADSDEEDILSVQKKLYFYGLLDGNTVVEGVLDYTTLSGIAQFQTLVNDHNYTDSPLPVIDPENCDEVDADTVSLLLNTTLSFK